MFGFRLLSLWLFLLWLAYNTADTWLKNYRRIVSGRLDCWLKVISSHIFDLLFFCLHDLLSCVEFLLLVSQLSLNLKEISKRLNNIKRYHEQVSFWGLQDLWCPKGPFSAWWSFIRFWSVHPWAFTSPWIWQAKRICILFFGSHSECCLKKIVLSCTYLIELNAHALLLGVFIQRLHGGAIVKL